MVLNSRLHAQKITFSGINNYIDGIKIHFCGINIYVCWHYNLYILPIISANVILIASPLQIRSEGGIIPSRLDDNKPVFAYVITNMPGGDYILKGEKDK
jgi:hypothetical protein